MKEGEYEALENHEYYCSFCAYICPEAIDELIIIANNAFYYSTITISIKIKIK